MTTAKSPTKEPVEEVSDWFEELKFEVKGELWIISEEGGGVFKSLWLPFCCCCCWGCEWDWDWDRILWGGIEDDWEIGRPIEFKVGKDAVLTLLLLVGSILKGSGELIGIKFVSGPVEDLEVFLIVGTAKFVLEVTFPNPIPFPLLLMLLPLPFALEAAAAALALVTLPTFFSFKNPWKNLSGSGSTNVGIGKEGL